MKELGKPIYYKAMKAFNDDKQMISDWYVKRKNSLVAIDILSDKYIEEHMTC